MGHLGTSFPRVDDWVKAEWLSPQACKNFRMLTTGLLSTSPKMGEESVTRRGEWINLAPLLRICAVKGYHKDMKTHIGPRWEMEKKVGTGWTWEDLVQPRFTISYHETQISIYTGYRTGHLPPSVYSHVSGSRTWKELSSSFCFLGIKLSKNHSVYINNSICALSRLVTLYQKWLLLLWPPV